MSSEYENRRSREQELKEALTDLGEYSVDDLEEAKEITIGKGETDEKLRVKSIVTEYIAALQGKSRQESSSGTNSIVYRQTGKWIASKTYIHLTAAELYNFADTSNISGSKDMDRFFIQFKDAFNKVQNVYVKDERMTDEYQSMIIKLFKDAMVNIGEVITNESGNMKLILERYQREKEEYGMSFNDGQGKI